MNNNHIIDPTFFYDAIDEFAFNYDIFVKIDDVIDDNGCKKPKYEKSIITGSLQTQGISHHQSKEGNTDTMSYNFYCKSLYRIDLGDIIKYKNNYLRVDSVHEYDEWGVREASLTMIQLTGYKNFEDYENYLTGEIVV